MSEPGAKPDKTTAAAPTESGGGRPEPDPDLAAALKYDPAGDNAPRVVAKGKGEIARRIIEIAQASGVPIRRDADLAGLLEAVELDDEIPLEAFAAVAEVLAYIYRANRDSRPPSPEPQEPEEEQA